MKSRILSNLPENHPWAPLLRWYDSLPSTNSAAKELAAAGAPHGTALVAGSQTAGRGRLGRSFCSQAGQGVYMSVILRPECPPAGLMHLTCAAGVAACDAVEDAFGFRPGIKWINDLVADGKKLGGILTELSISPVTGSVDYAVVGIGINCRQRQLDFPEELRAIACSAAMVTGQDADPAALTAALLIRLEKMSGQLPQRDAIMARYCRDCVTPGNQITMIRGDGKRNGTALQILPDGSLEVRYEDGTTEAVSSGEVSVRGMLGYV